MIVQSRHHGERLVEKQVVACNCLTQPLHKKAVHKLSTASWTACFPTTTNSPD